MKRAALYVRVSTQEQKMHGLSVDNQIDALQTYAKDHDYTVIGLYNDAGISARKKYTRRPALLRLLEDCKEGKVDVILFTRLDRWFRSVSDYYQVQDVLDECKVSWRAIWGDYETETSSGVLRVNIMLSIAQAEADQTSERLKSVFAYKRSKGDYIGSAPVGYKVKDKRLVKDPEKQQAIETLFRVYLETLSVYKATKAASEFGISPDKIWVYRVLKRPVYAGILNGEQRVEPYITEEQHKFILSQIGKNCRKTKAPNSVYKFSGLLYCKECDKRLAGSFANQQTKTGVRKYVNYLCYSNHELKKPHKTLCISERKVEKYLLAHLQEELNAHIMQVKKQNHELSLTNEQKKKEAIESKLNRLLVLFEDGDITLDKYRKKRDALREELSQVNLSYLPVPEPLPEDWQNIYMELDEDHKRRFWKKIIKRIVFDYQEKYNPTIEFL